MKIRILLFSVMKLIKVFWCFHALLRASWTRISTLLEAANRLIERRQHETRNTSSACEAREALRKCMKSWLLNKRALVLSIHCIGYLKCLTC